MRYALQIRNPYSSDVLVEARTIDDVMEVVGRILPHAPDGTKITMLDGGKPSVYWVKGSYRTKRTAVRR